MRILASAYRIRKYPRIKRYLTHAKELFIDSGMISAWRKGEQWWTTQQQYVVKVANEVRADYVAMLDLPCEPHLLEQNRFTVERAQRLTIDNARDFIDAQTPSKKVFVVQGYTKEAYQYCINAYRDLGILSLTDIWIAIGSVCMRSPKNGLYEIASLVRREIPHHHLHAFGIGRKSWIDQLRRIGIDSFDSATASLRAGYNRGLTRIRGKRTDAQVIQQYACEMVLHEMALNAPTVQLPLF